MPIELHEQKGGKLLHVRFSGKLTKEDYTTFVPRMEDAIARNGKVNIYIEMTNFHGWEPAAMWDDFKFGLKHGHDIQRLAFIGEKRWEHWLVAAVKPFTPAEVRYFQIEEADSAMTWVGAN